MAAITQTKIAAAQAELDLMRGTLARWLKYRSLNDQVLSGALVPTKLPPAAARQLIVSTRSRAHEQQLANQLHALLERVLPNAPLPNPNVAQNPAAAAQLAAIAITGQAPVMQANPAAMGGFWGSSYMWPVLIVGGVLIAVVTAIRSAAEVAMDAEEKACIQSGACTDYGFWLKVGGMVAIGWFAWEKLGVGTWAKRQLKGGG